MDTRLKPDTDWKKAYAALYGSTAHMLVEHTSNRVLIEWDMLRRKHPDPEL